MLLNPPTSGKAGLSFFILLSDDPGVLRAVHAYNDTCSGCLAYPLASIPPGMALTVDKVQASVGGAPALLHALLSCLEPMPQTAFSVAVESWAGKQVCMIAGAGAPGHVGRRWADDAVTDTLKRAAATLTHDTTAPRAAAHRPGARSVET